ncbi:MAG: hypothetical protein ACI8R9_002861 [Paraglaciecola sp.]|jgi:hypothetical protein
MSIELEIQDGSPHWWNSSDVWVVPGNDPSGSPGQPIAGQTAYLWGRVHNNGSTFANSAQVNFYWSNPATGVLRSNSTFIGASFVDLDPGETQEVLCLTPWMPTIVNDGHECIVAEVIHVADPLPSPLPDAFDPPAYLQIAQRNLSVLSMKTSMMILPIELAASPREKKSLEVMLEFGEEIDRKSIRQLGMGKIEYTKKPIVKAELTMDRGCGKINTKHCCCHLRVDLAPGTSQAVYLKVDPCNLKPGVYIPINVIAREGDKIVGGITFIVIRSEEE